MSQLALIPDDRGGAGDRDCWATPPELVRGLSAELGQPFALDVCAFPWSAKAPRFYTAADDGLVQPWHLDAGDGLAWCNPPFSDPRPWARKAWRESFFGCRTVMLLPSFMTGHGWFHQYVVPRAAVRFLGTEYGVRMGRVRFQPPPGVAPSSPAFPCLVALWSGRWPDRRVGGE